MFDFLFGYPAWVLSKLYEVTNSYIVAIAIVAALVMLLVTPLNLSSTRSMLEMQRLAPKIRQLQAEYGSDRQAMSQAQMELYRENGVSPFSSCLPIIATMPVFIIMFRLLTGLTYRPVGANGLVARTVMNALGQPTDAPIGFLPQHLSVDSVLYKSLYGQTKMMSLGLDLSLSPSQMMQIDFGRGLIYASLVAVLGLLYLFQQRMISSRNAGSPGMSESQQRLMQYLPVIFAFFQIFFLLGLVVYYIIQTILRIGQQYYITRRYYSGDNSLGKQAQVANERARQIAKDNGDDGGFLAKALGGGNDADKPSKSSSKSKSSSSQKETERSPKKSTSARPTSTGKSRATNRPKGSSPRRRKKR